MCKNQLMKNFALLVGNGVNAITNAVTWGNLLKDLITFCDCKDVIYDTKKPFPMFYEEIFLSAIVANKSLDELEIKNFIAERVAGLVDNPVHQAIRELGCQHVMTTNYDLLLEGNSELTNNGAVNETRYSIFRRYESGGTSYWHLHGDQLAPSGINLGYEHYMGQTQKMRNYVTSGSNYKNVAVNTSLVKRLKSQGSHISIYSWIDLFFTRDIHIVGLTLDFVEADLWWLLTYRARQKHSKRKWKISNKIFYYVPVDFSQRAPYKIRMLKMAGVEVREVNAAHDEQFYLNIIAELSDH